MHSLRDLNPVNGSNFGQNQLLYQKSHNSYPVRPANMITADMYQGNPSMSSQLMPQPYHPHMHHPHLMGHLHYSASLPVMPHHEHHNPSYNRVWDVWVSNFREGMKLLRALTQKSKYVAVDTEFPGVVAKVFGDYVNSFEQSYHNIKINIDVLKPIQIGFSFFNERGQPVDQQISTIQFNMRWNVEVETFACDSINLLEMSGINFEKLKQEGITTQDFAEAFISSGLALNDKVTWIGFHAAYDFAYMMKVCTDWEEMPQKFRDFHKLLLIYFPRIVDLKAIASEYKLQKLGLTDLAGALKVARNGHQHQAGSDAMLTGETFFRFLDEYTQGQLDNNMLNLVYGLNYGVNCQQFSMNLFSNSVHSDSELSSSNLLPGCKTATHSADQSGRNSPADSTSGHKSS
ncbi:CCR4-NOT transcription complex subunit 7 [Cichlidogyrus casuarinus]|uniref:poly(A)-specific ribonuclease n=1 Tax=Cichlidogyrus casuarinus TaxID=1844966 RepID=A0ABD2Q6D5_9PLAT